MRFVKWGLGSVLALFVLAFLHYTLPQTDIVRIVGTENRRIDFGENSWFWASPDVGTAAGTSRDVFFINAVYPDGDTMEYRNEDTGWGWPPYFKMDSFSTQTQAKELISPAATPVWVAVTHYGWRNQLFTIFPNAVSVRQVAGPDVTIIPWASIVILTALAIFLWMIRRMWLQFRERMIDPAVIEAQETADEARGWFRRTFGRKPRV
jgi:hypothetical protein